MEAPPDIKYSSFFYYIDKNNDAQPEQLRANSAKKKAARVPPRY